MNTSPDELANYAFRDVIEEIIDLIKKDNGHDAAVSKIADFGGEKATDKYSLIQNLLAVGQLYRSKALIQCALEAFDKVEAQAPDDHNLYYNVATCYLELYDMRTRNDGANLFDCEDLVKQAVKYAEKASPSDPRVLTNLGNLYDVVGRPVEAINCYERALCRDKGFGMALGNKATAMEQLAPITRYSTTYYVYAHQLYQAAFSHKQSIIDIGGRKALESFQKHDSALVRRFTESGSAELLKKDLGHKRYEEASLSEFVKFYTDFCIRNDLYLNLHIIDRAAQASVGDAIIPQLVTRIEDGDEQQYVHDIIFRLNEIIEAYMTARMHLVQSQYTTPDFSAISQQTALVNLLDYSVSNIYIGYLKSAYKEAFSALDKIAILVNHYLDLGFPEDQCSYRSIWYEHNTRGRVVQPPIVANKVKAQGHRLFGLYLLCQEIGSSEDQAIRNALTHRYLRVYRAVKGPEDTYLFEELTQITVDVLYKIKCAIMYISLFLESKEETKRGIGFIAEMPLETGQKLDIW